MDSDLITPVNTSSPARLTLWRYKWKIYLVDQEGKKTVEKESRHLYDKKKDCIRDSLDAKRKLPIILDDGIKYKRFLVRRRSTYRTVDEIDEKAARSAADRVLTLMFAEKIREKVYDFSREKCPACEINDPSQLHHDFLMLDFSEHLYMYFKDAMQDVNDHYVLTKWETYIEMSDLCQKIHPIYLIKYRCPAWLNKNFKTTDWRSHVFRMCEELDRIERVFRL